MPNVIGTATTITWAATANPASQNITPPTGCNAVAMFWTYYTSTSGAGLLSATLNSAAPDQVFEPPTSTPDYVACGVCVWYDPPTGAAIALDVAWDNEPAEGPLTAVEFIQNADTAGWRDVDAAQSIGTVQQTITLTTVSGDLVVAFDQKYLSPTPATESGWTSRATQVNNSERGNLRYIVATGSTQTASTQNTDYSTIVGVVFGPPAAAGGSSIHGRGLYSRFSRDPRRRVNSHFRESFKGSEGGLLVPAWV